jgi:hypothetical protein
MGCANTKTRAVQMTNAKRVNGCDVWCSIEDKTNGGIDTWRSESNGSLYLKSELQNRAANLSPNQTLSLEIRLYLRDETGGTVKTLNRMYLDVSASRSAVGFESFSKGFYGRAGL